MAAVFANINGEIIGFRASKGIEESPDFEGPPDGTNYTKQFDEKTNPGLVADLLASPATFAMPGGTLVKDGTEVTINPDEAAYRNFRLWADRVAKARAQATTPVPWTSQEVGDLVAEFHESRGRVLSDNG